MRAEVEADDDACHKCGPAARHASEHEVEPGPQAPSRCALRILCGLPLSTAVNSMRGRPLARGEFIPF